MVWAFLALIVVSVAAIVFGCILASNSAINQTEQLAEAEPVYICESCENCYIVNSHKSHEHTYLTNDKCPLRSHDYAPIRCIGYVKRKENMNDERNQINY